MKNKNYISPELLSHIKNRIDEIYPEILSIRNDLHMHPELSEKEVETEKKITKILDSLNIPYECNIAGHGIVATIYGKNKDFATGIRADIDALPIYEETDTPYKSLNEGVMHACGHDIHTSILLGTAKILKEMENDLPGSVKLFFEPAEETVGGAKPLIDAGCLENPKVSTVLGLHVDPTVDVGKVLLYKGVMNAASTEFQVTIEGKSSHGAKPHQGLDTIPIACNIINNLQTIITRRLSPTESSIITVGKINGGVKENVIAEETEFSGTIRVLKMENREFIKEKVTKISNSIAEANDAKCTVNFYDGYPVLENDDDLFYLMKNLLNDTISEENTLIAEDPSLGADDFAYFCQYAKGLYFNIGCHKLDKNEYYSLHSNRFDPDVNCIKTGILAEVLGSYQILKEYENNDK